MSKGKKIVLCCVIALLIIGNVFQFAWNNSQLRMVAVVDRETAVAIARAVAVEEFAPIYCPVHGYVERYIFVVLHKSTMAWHVIATRPLRADTGGGMPLDEVIIYAPDALVGAELFPEVVIRMRDGRILSIGYETYHISHLTSPPFVRVTH